MKKVIVAGKFNVDTFYYVDELKVSSNNVASQIKVELGGKAGNVAVCLRKMGLDVAVTGCIGKDGFGSFIKKKLSGYGIDTTHLKECKAPTGRTAIAVTKDGENTMLNYPGANLKFTPDMIDWTLVEKGKVLFVQFGLPPSTVFELSSMMKRAGAMVYVDPPFPSEVPWDAFSYFDYFAPNQEEAIKISGKRDIEAAAKHFLKREVEVVIVKMGKLGVKIFSEKRVVEIPAVDVDVVDTTGAGDAFNCGFIYGRMNGMDDESSAKIGVVVASIAVTKKGSSSAMPSIEEVREFVKDRGLNIRV